MIDSNEDLDKRIARLDTLIAERDDAERGLGLRLALGLAREIRDGTPLGTETADLLLAWKESFGEKAAEEAVAQAGALLKNPARMAEEIGRRFEGKPSEDDLSGVDEGAGHPHA